MNFEFFQNSFGILSVLFFNFRMEFCKKSILQELQFLPKLLIFAEARREQSNVPPLLQTISSHKTQM